MSTMASQITSLTIVYSTVYSGTDQRKHRSSVSLALWGEFTGDRWIPHTKDQWRGKCFHLMTSSWHFPITSCWQRCVNSSLPEQNGSKITDANFPQSLSFNDCFIEVCPLKRDWWKGTIVLDDGFTLNRHQAINLTNDNPILQCIYAVPRTNEFAHKASQYFTRSYQPFWMTSSGQHKIIQNPRQLENLQEIWLSL